MLSPTPVSLFCALLLCLPLAVVFTINTTTTPPTSSSDATGKNDKPRNINTKTPIFSAPPPPPMIVPEDDKSLFRVAARVNPKPSPPGAAKKLAFMFLTTTPLTFAPLWEIYFNSTHPKLYNIYIHADPTSHYDSPFQGVFSNRVIPSKPTHRFTPTLISAARRLLSHALLHDPSNYMFTLLSSSCIPLHSFNFTYETLIRSKKSFIEILKNQPGIEARWAARGEEVMLPEVTLESCRIGSQFWTLTRKHARLVVRDERLWSKFKLPCLHWDTCYPEENYFPTLLSMRDPRGCIPATLTHVDWRGRSDGHPHTYEPAEVGPELILTLRSDRPRYGDEETNGSVPSSTQRHDPFLFARKFSPDSIQPLMSIASDVIFKD